ncbi:MAG: ABC transporter permease [Elusimicrobiota bacterium]
MKLFRILRNKMVLSGSVIVGLLILTAVFNGLLKTHQPHKQNLKDRLKGPSQEYIMGTDDLGRDVYSRIVEGSKVSLTVGIVAVGISILVGVPLGLAAGFFGGWTDKIIMRLVDVMLCFPTIFLVLMVITFLEPSIVNVMIVIGLTSWPGLTRYVRGEALSVRNKDYIKAVRAMGLSKVRILFVHMLPNTIAPVLITATLGVGTAILTESILSFLGLGVQPPAPSWGNILTTGKDYMGREAWWLIVFPGFSIFITVLAFNLIGEGLRDVLDPRSTNKP